MGLNFLSNKSASAPKKALKAEPDDGSDDKTLVKKAGSGLNFLKTGNATRKAMAHEDARAEAQQLEFDKMWRFMLKPDEDAKITFLDGELGEDGILDITTFYEHFMKLNGKPRNFICVAETDEPEECPICERGDTPKSFVGVMSILDHRKYKIQTGQNAGKIVQNDRKLFVAKRGTLKMLTKIAMKRAGLAGCSFDVSRGNDKTPSVGNVFDFTSKFESFDEIAEKFSLKLEDVAPANYMKELTYYTAAQLLDLGVGKAIVGPGYGGKSSFGSKKVSASGMADKL